MNGISKGSMGFVHREGLNRSSTSWSKPYRVSLEEDDKVVPQILKALLKEQVVNDEVLL